MVYLSVNRSIGGSIEPAAHPVTGFISALVVAG